MRIIGVMIGLDGLLLRECPPWPLLYALAASGRVANMLPRENSLLVAATATSAISEKRTLPIAGLLVKSAQRQWRTSVQHRILEEPLAGYSGRSNFDRREKSRTLWSCWLLEL